MIKDAGKGVFVTHWLGGDMDFTTGNFSIGVSGFEIVNGLLGAPVGEMIVSGNMIDLFARLIDVGNNPLSHQTIHSPSMIFENVQFSGV